MVLAITANQQARKQADTLSQYAVGDRTHPRLPGIPHSASWPRAAPSIIFLPLSEDKRE